ncbi:CBL-interacting serine/threonine-protein kinase 2 [Rhynchospora pubera]|uniref:non-specific serine/threonine protein kinase n=1 Tax=Rhynchospora pubera TaxID=906938 RepID=A0AAV8HXE6_9POAL|nr:CBL-interacting serine/threonine-protein kinase 2 [Rhynchospora pubera]
MDSRRTVLMQKYETGRLLGQGNFAKVYYARNLKSNQAVAIKMIDKEKVMRVGLMEQIKREISVMRLVRHPYVVHLYEVMASKSKIYFVMEYAKGGELFNKVAKGRLKEEVARKYFHQLILAVDYCHSRGVFHRDLKPENLLLDEHENLKVSDFGLSALVESKRQDGLLHTTCGTPAYVAPEVIGRKGYDGAKADIWSCGVILFVLVAGYLPFHDTNLMEMYRKISRADYRCPSWFSFELKKLLVRILDPDPNTRITIPKIKETSWYQKDCNTEGEDKKNKSVISDDSSGASTSSGSGSREGGMRESMSLPNLNAFDIISLSTGFDLSRLFEERESQREVRFTSRQPAPTIISKLEDLAARLRLRVKKKDNGLFKLAGTKEGRKGVVELDAEIFEVAPEFYLVEMKKTSGDTLEYKKMMKEDIRPALKDIVWAWQGDHHYQLEHEKPQDNSHEEMPHQETNSVM